MRYISVRQVHQLVGTNYFHLPRAWMENQKNHGFGQQTRGSWLTS